MWFMFCIEWKKKYIAGKMVSSNGTHRIYAIDVHGQMHFIYFYFDVTVVYNMTCSSVVNILLKSGTIFQ